VITKEEFPRVLILRQTDLSMEHGTWNMEQKSKKITPCSMLHALCFGPYTSKKQMEIALKIIRKIFPFHSNKNKTEKGCLDFQLGRCPGPYAGAISKTDYARNIRGIRMILEGKKKGLLKKMEKEMESFAKKEEFEKATEIRNKIFALKHIQDIALISKGDENFQIPNPNFQKISKSQIPISKPLRIEAYDISNISGQFAVGSMVVFENGEPNKNEYRKFKIKTVEGSNDVGMMAEVLFRRFRNDWEKPDLILLDGGIGHLNMAKKILKELGLEIPLVAVAKGPSRKKLKLQMTSAAADSSNLNVQIQKILEDKNLIKSIMDEAHRFAITYHKKVRKKEFI
jgi:excinuclease ABC subunit C